MKKIVFVYGIIAGAINIGAALLLTNLFGEEMAHANMEWLGYLVMIIALTIIFVGIKQFRDKHLGGVITFGKAFLAGLYIALVASTIYVGSWEVYIQTSGEDWIENYQASLIESMREQGAAEEEISVTKEKLEYYADMYENPFTRVLITLSEILPVGILISLISAALLRKSSFMPDSENVDMEAAAI